MTVQAWLVFTPEEREEVMLLNVPGEPQVIPRVIDNPLADNMGEGVVVGKSVVGARLLNDPVYTAFYEFCNTLPIRTWDSDVLFIPITDV